MKKILVTLFITLVYFGSFSQETKKVSSKNGNIKEVYYVLKSENDIRHGAYTKNGVGNTKENGQYELNKKVGIWEFYSFNGELEQKFNYSENKVEFNDYSKNKLEFFTQQKGAFLEAKFDRAPVFIGGTSKMYNYISSSMMAKYPAEARRNGIQGKVFVSAIITSEGKLIDEKVIEGIGYGCDELALQAIQSIPDEWLPGIIGDEPVSVQTVIPVFFKLN